VKRGELARYDFEHFMKGVAIAEKNDVEFGGKEKKNEFGMKKNKEKFFLLAIFCLHNFSFFPKLNLLILLIKYPFCLFTGLKSTVNYFFFSPIFFT
jgi:hypothetical protein